MLIIEGFAYARGHKPANYKDIPVREQGKSENQYQDQVREYNNVINPSA